MDFELRDLNKFENRCERENRTQLQQRARNKMIEKMMECIKNMSILDITSSEDDDGENGDGEEKRHKQSITYPVLLQLPRRDPKIRRQKNLRLEGRHR